MFDKIVYCTFSVLASFGVTFLGCLLLFCTSRERRSHFLLRFLPGLIVYLAVVIFFTLNYFANVIVFSEAFLQAVLWIDSHLKQLVLLFILTLAVALCVFCFRLSVRETIFFASAGYLMQHIPVSVYAGIRSLVPQMHSYFLLLFYAAFYVLFWFIFVRRIRDDAVEVGNKTLIATVFGAAVVIFLFEFIIEFSYAFTANLYKFFSCFILLFLLFGFFEQGKKKLEKEKLEYILKMEQAHYENLRENMEIINRKSHDLKYMVALLRNMDDKSDKTELLDSLTREAEIYGDTNLTENNALNAILAEKMLICKQRDIKLYCIVDGKLIDFMAVQDVYVLFGNALDNAIEHVSQLEDAEKRIVHIKVCRRMECVFIQFENCLGGAITFNGRNSIATTKGDKTLHGYGIKSIAHIVEKYKGKLSICAENNTFALNIIFPDR